MTLRQSQGFSLFDRGKETVSFTIETSAPWLDIVPQKGTIGGGRPPYDIYPPPEGIKFVVNWNKFPAGSNTAEATITIHSGDQHLPTFTLPVQRLSITPGARGFYENDGYVAIEAAHTSARTIDGDVNWEELPGYGLTRSAMTIFPVTAASNTYSKASLEYSMYLFDSGDFQAQFTLAPTLGFVPGRGLRFGVSVDDGPRTIIDELEHNSQHDWEQAVSDSVRRVTLPISIAKPGNHTLHIWAVDPGVVLERIVVSHGPLKPSYLGPPESAHFPGM